jgi:hypothetical protein
VTVSAISGSGFFMDIRDTPSGSTTLARATHFIASRVGPGTHTPHCVLLEDCQGTAWFEDCIFHEGTTAPIVIENCDGVVFERCSAVGSTG